MNSCLFQQGFCIHFIFRRGRFLVLIILFPVETGLRIETAIYFMNFLFEGRCRNKDSPQTKTLTELRSLVLVFVESPLRGQSARQQTSSDLRSSIGLYFRLARSVRSSPSAQTSLHSYGYFKTKMIGRFAPSHFSFKITLFAKREVKTLWKTLATIAPSDRGACAGAGAHEKRSVRAIGIPVGAPYALTDPGFPEGSRAYSKVRLKRDVAEGQYSPCFSRFAPPDGHSGPKYAHKMVTNSFLVGKTTPGRSRGVDTGHPA